MLVEGMSIRSIERLLGIHHDTVIRLALRVGKGCQQLHDSLVRLTEEDPPHLGDQYAFVAMDADTKMVLSYLVAKRTLESTIACLEDLRSRIVGRPQITTDGFSPYIEAVERAFGHDVDFAMLVKEPETPGPI